MRKEIKKIVKLSAIEVLRLIDSAMAAFELASTQDRQKRFALHKYLEKNSIERSDFLGKVSYLRRRGYINRFTEGKEYYAEITDKGLKHLRQSYLENISIERPEHWDKKWRVIIFDIPEKERVLRDCIRLKLYQIGFLQVQKSVFVFPFECTNEINLICDNYGGRAYIKYLIADIIEGENDIIEQFLSNGTLNKTDLNS